MCVCVCVLGGGAARAHARVLPEGRDALQSPPGPAMLAYSAFPPA